MSDEDLLSLLFTRPRPALFVDGVVVLRDDAFSWERYEPRKYVYRTGPAEILDLSLVLVGVGARRRAIGCGRRASTPEPSRCYPNIRKSS
jgi:hypothetical protein